MINFMKHNTWQTWAADTRPTDESAALDEAISAGPGRPRRAVPAKMRSIYLTEDDVKFAKILGKGKISAGVRVALKKAVG